MQEIQVQFVKRGNKKLGGIPSTNSESKSCPKDCPFKNSGCYGEGFHTKMNWDLLDSRDRGGDWIELCSNIEALPNGTIWRHNVVGDLPHNDEKIEKGKIQQLVHANIGKLGYTFTHHNRGNGHNQAVVKYANDNGFTVNLSANNLEHADQLADLGIAPVVTVLPESVSDNTETPNGRKVVICPAISKDKTCKECKLCARPNRQVVIGFPAHGNTKRKAEKVYNEFKSDKLYRRNSNGQFI